MCVYWPPTTHIHCIYICVYILERLVAAQPEIAWSPSPPKEWSLINENGYVVDPWSSRPNSFLQTTGVPHPFPIWRSRQRSLPPQAHLEPLPFAAEAQGFGTCDLEQAVVSVGFQKYYIYIYVTIRGKHGSHELDGPTNQELLQGENSRTRFFFNICG